MRLATAILPRHIPGQCLEFDSLNPDEGILENSPASRRWDDDPKPYPKLKGRVAQISIISGEL